MRPAKAKANFQTSAPSLTCPSAEQSVGTVPAILAICSRAKGRYTHVMDKISQALTEISHTLCVGESVIGKLDIGFEFTAKFLCEIECGNGYLKSSQGAQQLVEQRLTYVILVIVLEQLVDIIGFHLLVFVAARLIVHHAQPFAATRRHAVQTVNDTFQLGMLIQRYGQALFGLQKTKSDL